MIAFLVAAAAAALSFEVADGDPTRVVVRAASAPENAELSLHLLDAESGKPGPPMFADIEREKSGDLLLRPQFPLSRGQSYRAKLGNLIADYEVPKRKAAAAPKVTRIYPSAKKLPANLLKFYLQFDRPMREGHAIFDQIHLEDSDGNRDHSPWRRQELWNQDATRFTLWIHPGRVKQGVNLREELGPVLHPNETYTLVIDPTLRSAAGKPLGREFRHTFATLPEDHDRPDPSTWTLTVPPAGTQKPLIVETPEPLDHALAQRYLTVPGTTLNVDKNATRFVFTPEEPWKADPQTLQVDEFLEDLAGNTPLRVFDTDLSKPEPKELDLTLTFHPRKIQP